MIRCANCKELISECSDTMAMKHLNKECEFKEKASKVLVVKKTTTPKPTLNVIKTPLNNAGYFICPYCHKEIQKIHESNHVPKCRRKHEAKSSTTTKLSSNDLGICKNCFNYKNGKCIKGRPLGHGTSMCLYFNK